jgi:hypothetical protein
MSIWDRVRRFLTFAVKEVSMIIPPHRLRRRVGAAVLLAGLLAVGVTGSWAVEPTHTAATQVAEPVEVPLAPKAQGLFVELQTQYPTVKCFTIVDQYTSQPPFCVVLPDAGSGVSTPAVGQPAPTTQTPSTTAPTATTTTTR